MARARSPGLPGGTISAAPPATALNAGMPEAMTAQRAAIASIKTRPKLSPPRLGATMIDASPSKRRFSASSTRPAYSTFTSGSWSPSGRSAPMTVSVAPGWFDRTSGEAAFRIERPLRGSSLPRKATRPGTFGIGCPYESISRPLGMTVTGPNDRGPRAASVLTAVNTASWNHRRRNQRGGPAR